MTSGSGEQRLCAPLGLKHRTEVTPFPHSPQTRLSLALGQPCGDASVPGGTCCPPHLTPRGDGPTPLLLRIPFPPTAQEISPTTRGVTFPPIKCCPTLRNQWHSPKLPAGRGSPLVVERGSKGNAVRVRGPHKGQRWWGEPGVWHHMHPGLKPDSAASGKQGTWGKCSYHKLISHTRLLIILSS